MSAGGPQPDVPAAIRKPLTFVGAEDAAAPACGIDGCGPVERPLEPIHDEHTAAGRVGLAFKRAMVAVRKLRGRETQHPDEVSYAQFGLLFGLAVHGQCSARELAGYADLTPATVAQMLEHLEEAGFVKRSRSEQDRRVVISTLTTRGRSYIEPRYLRMIARWKDLLTEFSDAELDTAARVLNRLAEYFDAMPTAGSVHAEASRASADTDSADANTD